MALHLVAVPALAQVVPDAPENLTAANHESTTFVKVTLTWETPDDTGDSPITHICHRWYRPRRETQPTPTCVPASDLGGVNEIVTGNLQSGELYWFGVALQNDAGQGEWAWVSFTPGFSPTLAVRPISVAENAAATVVTVTATLGDRVTLFRAVPVKVSVGGGTATAGTDYAAVDDFTVTVPSGKLSAVGTFTLTPTDDDVDEGNETVEISATSTDFANIGSATLTITDDDERGLEFSTTGVTVTEASGAGQTATYTVALKSQPTAAVKVEVGSNDGTTATASPGTLRWTAAGWAAKKTVTVTAVDDQVDNTPDRTTTISHTAHGGDYGSVTGSVAVTVTDDEGSPAFSVGAASVEEGDSGEADLDFTVTLSPAADMQTTVARTTSDGTATAGADYTAGDGTLTFATGETSKTVKVKVKGDGIDEPNETLTLSSPGGGAGISTARGTGTITDDDDRPTVRLALSPASISENAGSSTVTAALSGASSEAVTVTVSATVVSPAVAGDFTLSSNRTLTIAAGTTSSTGTVAVTANDNDVVAANKTVTVSGAASGGRGVSNPSDQTLTITDDDKPYVLGVDAIPACGTTVTGMSVRPSKVLVLTPPPGEEVATEYRVVFDGNAGWLGALPIEPGGRSIRSSFGTYAELRRAYAGLSGFEYRLKTDPGVTARCTWTFEGDDGGTTPKTPTASLSASPNPVDEGSSVTVTARLSAALPRGVTIPGR